MPDFFDRLIARGTQPSTGGMPAPGQPTPQAGRAGAPSPGAAVAFALPRLPGPFERLAAERQDAFLEAVDEIRDVRPVDPGVAQGRPSFASVAGTGAAITPPPPLRDAETPRAPGGGPTMPGEQPPARLATPRQAPLLPRATSVSIVAAADASAAEHATVRADRPAADRERDAPAGTASRVERLNAQPFPPRTLAVPANAVRTARPVIDETRTVQAQPPAPPPVVVRIGRIEVRNTSPDRRERQPKRRAGRVVPKRTLAEYLAAASGGRNVSGNGWGSGR